MDDATVVVVESDATVLVEVTMLTLCAVLVLVGVASTVLAVSPTVLERPVCIDIWLAELLVALALARTESTENRFPKLVIEVLDAGRLSASALTEVVGCVVVVDPTVVVEYSVKTATLLKVLMEVDWLVMVVTASAVTVSSLVVVESTLNELEADSVVSMMVEVIVVGVCGVVEGVVPFL